MANTQSTDKATGGKLKITLIKSVFGQAQSHRATVRGLGLRRLNSSAVLKDTPEVRGMIRSANHLLKVEQA